jgi:hypothetical protein
VGGTVNHFPWGENFRPQNGAAALIDDPQPTDPVPRLEAYLLGGIDLPDLMGQAGPAEVGGGAAAGGGGTQARLAEPALEGALARDGGAGVVAAEQDAEQAGPPPGVVAAQGEGLLPEGLGGGARGGAGAVRGGHRLRAVVLEAAQEVADGARGQAEGAGDGGRGLALLKALPEGTAERRGHRRRHGKTSTREGAEHIKD